MYLLRVTDRAQTTLVRITWQPGHLRSSLGYEYDDALQDYFQKSVQPVTDTVSQAQNGHPVGACRYLIIVKTGFMMNAMHSALL